MKEVSFMKNKFKTIMSLLIISAITLTFAGTACKTKDVDGYGNKFKEFSQDEGVLNTANKLQDNPALPDVEVTEKLRWLSWFPVDETSPTAELFKAKYGVPQADSNDKNNVIHVINVTYESRYEQLAALIMGGDAPDMFQFEERNFPYGAYKNQFQPIDDIIDIYSPEWDPTREYIEMFQWGGKHYCAITEVVNSSSLLFYRNSIRQEAGLKDPYELWQKGEWTWDTFRQMLQDFSVPDKKWGISSFYLDESTILTTGIGLISIEDGRLKNNMDDARIERAMDFLQDLTKNNLRYPYHELSNYQISPKQFRSGEVLFWGDGPWRYQEEISQLRDGDNWPDDEICIVPFPRDPEADDYYQRGKQDALMLVTGSKNANGFKAWTQCAIIAVHDPEMKVVGREKAKDNFGWTNLQLEAMDAIRDLTPVWDFKNGIGEDVCGVTWASPVENLTKPIVTEGATYTQLREENRGAIEARIDDINATVD